MVVRSERIFYVDRETLKEKSHIEYNLQCQWCSKGFWAKKITAKFCSGACKQLNFIASKK